MKITAPESIASVGRTRGSISTELLAVDLQTHVAGVDVGAFALELVGGRRAILGL